MMSGDEMKVEQLETMLSDTAVNGDYEKAIKYFTELHDADPTEALYMFYIGLSN